MIHFGLYNKRQQQQLDSPLWTNVTRPLWPLDLNYFKIRSEQYDISLLRRDLSTAITNGQWINKDRPGDWKSITLKGLGGKEQDFLKETSLGRGNSNDYKYTPIMEKCPYFRSILDNMPTDVYLVRILRPGPQSRIKFHTDELVFNDTDNIIRCHVPIITHPEVRFQIGFPLNAPADSYHVWNACELDSKHLDAGYLWLTNVNTLHGVVNNSNIDRYHLCIDCRPPPHVVNLIRSRYEKN